MSPDLAALLVGTVLAVGSLAFVLYPLFFASAPRRSRAADSAPPDDSAILALREIEFDKATGKLSDADYTELKASYSTRALEELRASEPVQRPAEPQDPIEARVRAYRQARKECGTCGLRPEPDAVYCSTCGGYLGGVCPSCGGAVGETSAAFCSRCGATLAEGRERALSSRA